ncbi:MAG: DUF1653 domain-containing protein [Bacteroidetes bacterium]|nr:DUF1653 domain-containing protein [Bacteroidota bacterium]
MDISLPNIPPGKYRHYKGKEYEVMGMALHSETLEPMVVYKPLYQTPDIPEGILWVRPAAMWQEMVVFEGKTMERFTIITDPENR